MPVRLAPCVTLPERPIVLGKVLFLVAAIALLGSAPARAATVAVVRPPQASPPVNETLIRLYGELLSLGFEVQMARRQLSREDADPRAWLEHLARERGADAVVDIAGDPLAVTVWVADRDSGRLMPSRVDLEPNAVNANEQLAIRAIEVLRSGLLEMNLATLGRQTGNTSSGSVVAASAPPAARFGVELGAVGLTSLDGIGPALLPTVRLDWHVRPRWVVQAALAGLGTHASVERDADSATITQSYALVGGRYGFRVERVVRPVVGLAAGVMRTSLEGHANAPGGSHLVGQWSLLCEASTGAELALGRHIFLLGTVHAQVAGPYLAVHFGDTVVASSGRPNLLVSLALGAEL